jgi:hypothetical protein
MRDDARRIAANIAKLTGAFLGSAILCRELGCKRVADMQQDKQID